MRILVSGSGGFIGSALVPWLTSDGHEIVRLVRSSRQAWEEVRWDPSQGKIDAAGLEGMDAVVHLAGESIAEGRWTAAKKDRIRDSRVQGTRLLSEALARVSRPPKVLLAASAIGYYGSRGEELLTEESRPGSGFLAEVCQLWEAATAPAAERGIRVVNLRIGMVLSPSGGALGKMLLPFRLGLGGTLGDGRQSMSWVALDDVVGAIWHAIGDERLRGPVNAVAPAPVTNRVFTKTLGRVLSRPTVLPAPAVLLRGLLGELADQLLLSSARVLPEKLVTTNYVFRYPELDGALRGMLKPSSRS